MMCSAGKGKGAWLAPALVALMLVLVAAPGLPQAHASTELLTNGGFETGDLTGWAFGGHDNNGTAVSSPVYQGNYAAEIGVNNNLFTSGPAGSTNVASATFSFAVRPAVTGSNDPGGSQVWIELHIVDVNTGGGCGLNYFFDYKRSNFAEPPTFDLSASPSNQWTLVTRNLVADVASAYGGGTFDTCSGNPPISFSDTLQYQASAVNGVPGSYLYVDSFSLLAEPLTYSLTVSAGSGGSVGGTPSGSYEAGAAISISATPDTGYSFSGWTIAGVVIDPSCDGGSSSNPCTFTMPAWAVTAAADFASIPTYSLTVSAGAGGTVGGTASGSYAADTPISVVAAPDSGYTLSGWTVSGASCSGGPATSPCAFTMPGNAVTVTANFESSSPASMTVSYAISGGGTTNAPIFHYVQGGEPKSLTLNTAAQTVTADHGSSWSVTSNPLAVGSNERWQSGQQLSGSASTGTTVFVFYDQLVLAASYSVVGGGTGHSAPSFSATRFGSVVSVPLTTAPQAVWADKGSAWSVTNPLSGSGADERWALTLGKPGTGRVTEAFVLAFSYQHQFWLTMTSGSGGYISPASGWQYSAASAKITIRIKAFPVAGYRLTGWSGSGSGSYTGADSIAVIVMNGPITEVAGFELQTYTLTVSYSVLRGGSPAAPTFSYVQGGAPKTLTLTESPQRVTADYGTSWSVTNPLSGSAGECWSLASPAAGTVTGTSRLVFKYTHQFYVTVSVGTGTGTVSSNSGWVVAGGKIIVTASPASFRGWVGTGAGSYTGPKAAVAIIVNAAITETANFA